MKDFAKSIHVGNAGEVVHRDGDFKIKYNEKENGYELYYKSIYYDTYHTKQQALDKIELHKKREEDRKKSGNRKVGNSVTEKEFNSEADLRRWCIDHNYTYTPIGGGYYRLEDDKPGSHKPDIEAHVKSGNSKVGNADVVKDGNVWVVLYAEGTKSKEFNSEEEAKKFAAQVGNRDVSPSHLKDIEEQIKNWEHALEKVEGLEKEKAKKILEDLKKERQQIRDNVGNSDGTEKLFHSLEKDVEKKEEKNDEEIEKVGNETYQHKLYPGKYVIIEGNNYKIITDGKVEKSGVLTDAVLYGINQTYKRVDNSKVGNSSEYDILKQDPSKMHPAYKKAYEEALKKLSKEDEEMKKRFEREYGVKAKNEASDDKFAYVMREFDEGKLKTPDGKVVTDPAQAKAIAYSESKKAENGCARARNAMACNKKVRNSIYSELNKSDKRVVIEADGSWYVYDKNDKVIEQGRESNADNALGKFKAKGYNKKIGNAMDPIKYKGYTIKFRPNSQKYYISSGPGDTYVREYAYKEYASEQDAKDAIDHLK